MPDTTNQASLHVRNLRVRYGRTVAVDGIDLEVREASIATIIGANGAGKSSLLNAIMGVTPSAGEILFRSRAVAQLPLELRVSLGMSLVPELRELFTDMTVEDNLHIGAFRCPRKDRASMIDSVYQRFPRLMERRQQIAGTLSGGERQMLAIGRALMARPALLMLDEPSLGLAPRIVAEVFEQLVALREQGVSILLVEQNARAALRIADYAYVLELGIITQHGPAATIVDDERLIDSYLGMSGASY